MAKINFVSCFALKSQSSPSTLKIKCLLWWICALSFTGMFTWECYKTIDDFIKQPYVTGLKTVQNGSIELPVIRICPSSWINYTALQEQNITLQQLEMLMEGFVDSYAQEHFEHDKSYLIDAFNQFMKERPNFDFRNFFQEQISLKCSQIFHFCRWQSTYYNCCEGGNEPFNSRNPLINAGQCYLIYKRRSSPTDENYRQTVSGPGGGLMIHMSLPAEEAEVPGLTYHVPNAQGITVNTQRGFEPTFKNPIAVPIGHEALISIHARKTIRLHDCTDEGQQLYLANRYGKAKECLLECLINATLVECGCTFFTYGIIDRYYRYCTPFEFATCIRRKIMLNTQEIEEKCMKAGRCVQDCVTWNFQQTVSISPIHARRFEALAKRNGFDGLVDAKRVINIRAFYPEIGWEQIEEVETQTAHSLLSNIGGQLGLWLGFSMLSLIVSILHVIFVRSDAMRENEN